MDQSNSDRPSEAICVCNRNSPSEEICVSNIDIPSEAISESNSDRPSEAIYVAVTGDSREFTKVCMLYWKGICTYGEKCTFSHPPKNSRNLKLMGQHQDSIPLKICMFKFSSMCMFGEKCEYLHMDTDDYEERREDDSCRNNSVDSIQPVDAHGSRGSDLRNTRGQAGYITSTSAPVLASEPGNAHTAPQTLVRAALPNLIPNPPEPPDIRPKPRSSINNMKLHKIYGDWIDDLGPHLPGDHQQ